MGVHDELDAWSQRAIERAVDAEAGWLSRRLPGHARRVETYRALAGSARNVRVTWAVGLWGCTLGPLSVLLGGVVAERLIGLDADTWPLPVRLGIVALSVAAWGGGLVTAGAAGRRARRGARAAGVVA